MKEIMLIFPATQFDAVAANINTLKKEWGVEGTRDVVAEAVKRALVAEGKTPATEGSVPVTEGGEPPSPANPEEVAALESQQAAE
jgi:hypothetical protein